MSKNSAWVIFGLRASLAMTAGAASAQELKYRAGDRIEVDTIQSGSPQNAIYKKATVVEVDVKDKSYIVDVDPIPGQIPRRMRIMVRPYGAHWVRAIQGSDANAPAPAYQSEKLRVDGNGTVLADREVLDCRNPERQPQARNGQALPVELAKRLIRCLAEKPSDPGMDGATTVDITGFQPGTPRRWNKYEDTAFAGTPESMVHPILVTRTTKTFYRHAIDVVENKEQWFTCYVEVNHWYCGSAVVVKEGQKKQIAVTR